MNLLQPVQCIVYIWPGTCGISSKEGNIPKCDAGTTRLLILLFFSIGSYISRYQNKCIDIPCFSITEYNYHQGHKDTSALKSHDFEDCRQEESFSKHTRTFNYEQEQNNRHFYRVPLPLQNTDNCKKKLCTSFIQVFNFFKDIKNVSQTLKSNKKILHRESCVLYTMQGLN